MADPTAAPASSPPAPTNLPTDDPDWTDQVTDLIVDVVDRIHDSTTGRLITIAEGVVMGTLIAIVGVAVAIFAMIATTRAVDLAPGDIWIPYVALGAILTMVGVLLWGRRRTPQRSLT